MVKFQVRRQLVNSRFQHWQRRFFHNMELGQVLLWACKKGMPRENLGYLHRNLTRFHKGKVWSWLQNHPRWVHMYCQCQRKQRYLLPKYEGSTGVYDKVVSGSRYEMDAGPLMMFMDAMSVAAAEVRNYSLILWWQAWIMSIMRVVLYSCLYIRCM